MRRKGKQNIKWWGCKSACIAVTLLLATPLCAQSEVQTIWGPYMPKPDSEEVLHFFGPDSMYFFMITAEGRRGERIHLYQLGYDSLHVRHKALLTLPDIDAMQPMFYAPLEFGGRSYLVTTSEDPEGPDLFIHAFALDGDMQVEEPPRFLGRVHKQMVIRNSFLKLKPSVDGDYLMVLVPTEVDPTRNEKLNLRLLDRDLKVVYEKRLELPHPSAEVDYGEVLVDGDEAVYVLMSKPTPGRKEVDKVRNPGRDHFLLRYSWPDNTLSEKALSIGVKWIYNLMIAQNTNGHIQVFGYYSNMIDLIMSGTFSVSFDPSSGAILESGLSPFDRSFKTQFRMQGNVNERSELSLFRPLFAFPKPGNHMLLVSEKQDAQTSTVFNPATGTYFMVENYIYDEILFTQISEAGEAKLNFTIPKFQASSRSAASFTSFAAWKKHGSTYVVFNDHERNSTLDLHTGTRYSVLTGPANAQAVMYEVGHKGDITKHILYRSSPERCILIPYFTHPVKNGMIVLNQGSGGWQLARIEVQ